MDLYAVRTEVAAVFTAAGIRSANWAQSPVAAPFAMVGWPGSVDYQQSYGRGTTHIPDLPVIVVVGRANLRSAEKALGAYVAETGAKSIPALIEAKTTWASCDVVTVTSVTFPAATIGGVDYLGAEFHLDISGKGA